MIIEGEWYDHWGMSMVPKCKWWSYLVHCVVIALAQSLRKWFKPSLDLRGKEEMWEQAPKAGGCVCGTNVQNMNNCGKKKSAWPPCPVTPVGSSGVHLPLFPAVAPSSRRIHGLAPPPTSHWEQISQMATKQRQKRRHRVFECKLKISHTTYLQKI